LEIRVINVFLNHGVTLREVQRAAVAAASRLDSTHPFTSAQFRTDGRKILLEYISEGGSAELEEIADKQSVFRRIVEPFLNDIEFDGDRPILWWPAHQKKRIVIDPARSFGRPIVNNCGVPTEVLATAAQHAPIRDVARWYEVDRIDIRAATHYEASLAA